MRFIETPIFTRAVVALLDDAGYRSLQLALLQRPDLGAVIPHGGGLRKARWPLPGRGKRGGLRIVYFWDEASETFYMLYAYPKNEQENLTAGQLRTLSHLVREEFG
jgi:hypothetical protein